MPTGIEDKIDAMLGASSDEPANKLTDEVTEADVNVKGDEQASSQTAVDKPVAASTTTQNQPTNEPRPTRRPPANSSGDLLDPSSGEVIARAGKERRLYEAAQNAINQRMHTLHELERVTVERDAFKKASTLPQQLGLSVEEFTNAGKFMAHWKRSPVEAAKNMLAELRAMGHNVDELGSTVDMSAIKQMVTQAVQPFQQDREAQLREYEVAQQVDAQIAALYGAYPWAASQEQEILAVMQADESLTLREAALEVQAAAFKHNLDITKPLRPQLLALQNGQQPSNTRRSNRAAMPAPTGNAVNTAPRRAVSQTHDRSSKNIVLEAMREQGLNVDEL